MRKRRDYLILGVLGVVLAGVLVAVFWRDREPEYGGKRLSEWVEAYAVTRLFVGWERENKEAVVAIRHFSTNAVPHLLKWIRYETPAWRKTFYGIANPVLRRLNAAWVLWDKRVRLAEHAAWVFDVLGPDGQGAIPKLTQLLDGSSSLDCEQRAITALLKIGEEGRGPVLAVITNNQATRELAICAVRSIGLLETDAGPAIPSLPQLLTDSNWNRRSFATNALRKIDPQALEKAVMNGE